MYALAPGPLHWLFPRTHRDYFSQGLLSHLIRRNFPECLVKQQSPHLPYPFLVRPAWSGSLKALPDSWGLFTCLVFMSSLCQGTWTLLIVLIAPAASAAKSLQSCLTLCDPMDCSLPGFSIPGILQARTLEWVAISFSNA